MLKHVGLGATSSGVLEKELLLLLGFGLFWFFLKHFMLVAGKGAS